ncbi:MAG: DUF4446 family protein [Anaerolineae bacterium]
MQIDFTFFETYAPFFWFGHLLLDVVLLIWLLFLLRGQRALARRLQESKDSQDWKELLGDHLEEIRLTVDRANELFQRSEEVGRRLERSIQRVGVVRFNAFPDVGGDQSFAIALLDNHGDGVVISSLQGRTENRVYAKPLKRWDSTYALSDEEKQAIAKAYRRGG